MNVSQILDRILEFALDEDDATTSLRAKALADLNSAYQTVLQRIANKDLMYNLVTDNLTNVSVSALLPNTIKIYSVFDVTNKRKLKPTTIGRLEDTYPAMNDVNQAIYFYMDSDDLTLQVYPAYTTASLLRVRYWPKAVELTEDSPESDIKLPVDHHETLVSGGVWFMTKREDGFHDRVTKAERLEEFEERIRATLRNLKNKYGNVERTAYYDF